MNKIIFKTVSPVLCFVAAISAQQAEQNLPQSIPQQEVQQPLPPQVQQEAQQPLPQQEMQPQQQVQQPLPQQQLHQAQQPLPPSQPQPILLSKQNNCPQQVPTSIGLYARFNLNSVSYGFNDKKNDKIDMGIGFGGGIIRRTPITSSLDVNPEIGFFHRNLYSEKTKKGNEDIWYDETEFVLSIIPVIVQLTPFEFPLYVAAGFQVDFPILAKLTTTTKYNDGIKEDDEDTETYKGRAGYDLGVVWGLGYNITERFSFNFRSVVGLRSITGKRADARTPTQYGIGVTFF